MKKLTIYLVLILLVAGATGWLINNQSTSTLDVEETDFAVEGIDKIDKIVLRDRSGNESVLTKRDNDRWWVNDQQLANESRLETLLETMNKVDVKSPVPNSRRENVIKNLTSRSVKVEVYKEDELSRAYYVGGKTPDQKGTYMIIDGAENPYVTHIPGFTGYLSVRYFADTREWVTPKVFPFEPGKIASVIVEYPRHPEFSYKVDNSGENFLLHQGENMTLVDAPLNIRDIQQMLVRASEFQYQGEVTYKTKEQVDSIHSQEPIALVKVINEMGDEHSLYIHPKPRDRRTKTMDNPEGLDEDLRLGFINNDKSRLVLLQERTLAPILRHAEDFVDNERVSKN